MPWKFFPRNFSFIFCKNRSQRPIHWSWQFFAISPSSFRWRLLQAWEAKQQEEPINMPHSFQGTHAWKIKLWIFSTFSLPHLGVSAHCAPEDFCFQHLPRATCTRDSRNLCFAAEPPFPRMLRFHMKHQNKATYLSSQLSSQVTLQVFDITIPAIKRCCSYPAWPYIQMSTHAYTNT